LPILLQDAIDVAQAAMCLRRLLAEFLVARLLFGESGQVPSGLVEQVLSKRFYLRDLGRVAPQIAARGPQELVDNVVGCVQVFLRPVPLADCNQTENAGDDQQGGQDARRPARLPQLPATLAFTLRDEGVAFLPAPIQELYRRFEAGIEPRAPAQGGRVPPPPLEAEFEPRIAPEPRRAFRVPGGGPRQADITFGGDPLLVRPCRQAVDRKS